MGFRPDLGRVAETAQRAVRGEPAKRRLLELLCVLLGHAQVARNVADRLGGTTAGAEATADDFGLQLGQLRESRLDGVLLLALENLVLEVGRGLSAQLAQRGVAVVADRLIQGAA